MTGGVRCVVVAAFALAGCHGGERYGGGCPAGETCSGAVPRGLRFLPPPLFDVQPLIAPTAIAIGGTQTVQLVYDTDSFGDFTPLDLPYTTDDGGGPAVRVASSYGATVTLHGDAPGGNEVRILDASDGTLFDREMFSAAAVARVELAAVTQELTPPTLYAVGLRKLGIRLLDGSGVRLYDTSLALAGATRLEWDVAEVDAAVAGTYPVAVTAGGATSSFAITAVDHADAIVQIDGLAAVPSYGTDACFGAELAGQSVVGFAWTYAVDGVATAADAFAPDCVFVEPARGAASTVVQATAGGQTATFTLAVQ